MSVFLIPSSITKSIEQLIWSFWWSQDPNNKKLHWIKWETLTAIKKHGGLRFHQLKHFNLAMLAKLGWSLIQKSNTICAKLLREIYFPHTTFL